MAEGAWVAKNLRELRELADDQLVEQHDPLTRTGDYTVGPAHYLEEFARRRTERQGEQILKLTRAIGALTLVNVIAVVIDVATS